MTLHKHSSRRVVATTVATAMLLQLVSPAYATVMQLPGIYLAPPNPNVMFTLDDSGSMQSDAIPDMLDDASTAVQENAGLLADGNSNALGQSNTTFPGMWKANSGYLNTNFYRSDRAVARYLRSAAGNPLYYNPQVTYKPWPDPLNDQTPHSNGNADPTRVNIHPSQPFNTGRRLNITQRVNNTGTVIADSVEEDETRYYWRATYYVYNGTTPMPPAYPTNPLNVQSAFTKYEIKSASFNQTFPRASTRTDCTGAVGPTGCSRDQELQNFANWLQYYRSRNLMAKGGVAAAFALQGNNLRVGFTTINTGATVARGVELFSGTSRQDFYTRLYDVNTPGSTPLRESMDHVGQYFLGNNTSRGNPWAENPSNRPVLADSCRKSFHIFTTDGFWNGNNASSPANNNNDNFASTEQTPAQPTGEQYRYSDSGTPGTLAARFTVNPFRDNNAQNINTLADVAAYYWKTDLQGSLDNRLSPSTRDPAFWQHLTTFTVGLGITGSGQVRPVDGTLSQVNANGQYVVSNELPDTSPYYNFRGKPWLSDADLRDVLVAQRTPMQWTRALADRPTTGDDLIHAAMNSRGRYFSATNPTELASGLASALAEATNQNSSFASLGLANTSETAANNRLFQAVYNPYGWTGRLYAFALANGSFSTNPADALWEVSQMMPAHGSRSIFTWNAQAATPQGSPFTWAGLSSNQQAALGPTVGAGSTVAERQNVLNYLRGSIEHEVQNGGTLRDRVRDRRSNGTLGGVLGDVVSGSPLKGPDFGGGYERMAPTAPGRDTYAGAAGYRTADEAASRITNMRQSVFFGANDGMLHAVNSNDGVERFAYVPNSVFSVPNTYYKGASSTVKKLYEMSRPDYDHLFTANGAPQIGDAHIGPTLGTVQWRSILVSATGAGSRGVFAMDVTNPEVGGAADQFGTGKILWEFSEAQNADMGHVANYPHIAKMRDGTWVAMFGNGHNSSTGRAKLFLLDLQTGAIVWEQAVGTASAGNGLSQPNFLLNAQREVVAIWAGDLRGNMWKFDVNSASRADWQVAYGGQPLFTTQARQPITVMPELARFPNSNQAVVIFGTGKLFDIEDNSTDTNVNENLSRQAIYGIWDNESTRVTGLAQLVEQTVTAGSLNGYRRTSENVIDWGTRRGWYLQLDSGTGERVHVNPLIPVDGLATPVFIVANTPTNVPCSSGGTSRVFALDPVTGATPRFSVFDADRSASINAADGRNNVMSVSIGILSLPSFLTGRAPSGVLTEKPGSRGQTSAREGGVEFRDSSSGMSCGRSRMIAGVSNTSALNEEARLGVCTPRISWRQIQ